MASPDEVRQIVRNHYEPEESRRLGEPVFSVVGQGCSTLLDFVAFTHWLEGIVPTPDARRHEASEKVVILAALFVGAVVFGAMCILVLLDITQK